MPSRLPAVIGAALIATGLGLVASSAHADDTAPTTSVTSTSTASATGSTTASTTGSTTATDTVTTGAAAAATDAAATTTATTAASETETPQPTETTAPETAAPEIASPEVTADECGVFADVVTVPEVEGVHFVVPSPAPDEFDDVELGPGSYPAVLFANDPETLIEDWSLTPGGFDYEVAIEARAESEGPALSTTRLSYSAEPCPSTEYPHVTATAGVGTVTFTNPEGNPSAVVLWGDPDAELPDGQETVEPGRSVTVQTTRTRIAWVAINEAGLPEELGFDLEDVGTSTSRVGSWANRWAASRPTTGSAPLRSQLSPRLDTPSGAVLVIDPTFIDADVVAELREMELSMNDAFLGSGILDVPQPAASTTTTTTTATATPTLALTGPSEARPLAGLSVGLVLAGAFLVLAASGRVRTRRH